MKLFNKFRFVISNSSQANEKSLFETNKEIFPKGYIRTRRFAPPNDNIMFSSPRRMSWSQISRKRDADIRQHDERILTHMSFPFELWATPIMEASK